MTEVTCPHCGEKWKIAGLYHSCAKAEGNTDRSHPCVRCGKSFDPLADRRTVYTNGEK